MAWEQVFQQPISEWKNVLFNSFESTVFAKFPIIAEAKEWLHRHGAQFALMSGSGATVFGIFEAGTVLPPLPTHFNKVFCSERIHLSR
jgi:4-diphosphocytidyl-2-C-methyl-D-erythritol kinase